jgi:DNA-binding NtrC family response regulator
MPTGLIVEDNADDLLALADLFREKGFSTETAGDLDRARRLLARGLPEVALINERVGGDAALDMLNDLDPGGIMEIYLMSDCRSIETATRAMQLGVSDYFEKPVDRDRLGAHLDDLVYEIDCAGDGDAVRKNARGLLIGESSGMRRLYRMIRKSAPSKASILVVGESGTGKELVARTIHELSNRARCELVSVNCSAIAGELTESELFGHEKGSFTGAARQHKGFFERAAGGTLLLDEISEMDPALQAKLLRALERDTIRRVGGEKEIGTDVRIIAATNREPDEAIGDGQLREDLYYRLAQFPIRVPPLRDRGDDIELLARHFVEQQNDSSGARKSLDDDVLEAFRLYDWPGNVRELRNAIVHGYLLAGDTLRPEDMPEPIRAAVDGTSASGSPGVGAPMVQVEQQHILKTLDHFEGNKKKTAEALGISVKTLYNRLKQYRDAD